MEINKIQTPLAIKATGNFQFALYKEQDYTEASLIAELAPPGLSLEAADLETGILVINSVVPASVFVQVVTDYTITITTKHDLYPGASSIIIEFPGDIILPDTDTVLNISI